MSLQVLFHKKIYSKKKQSDLSFLYFCPELFYWMQMSSHNQANNKQVTEKYYT